MTDSQKPLEKKISEWLESQGYPLEMTVARSFMNSGYRVLQSDYFDDSESGDSRELDINASVQESIGDMLVRIKFVVECKSSDRPWLLFTRPRLIAAPASVAQRGCSDLGRKFICELAQNEEIQSLPLFKVSDNPAYGVTQAFTSGNDVTYGAAMSVTKAAAAQIKDANKYTSLGRPYCLLVFPVIVTDAPMFNVDLDETAEPRLQPVKSGVLIWRNRVMHGLHNIINIVHRDNVDEFAKQMLPCCKTLFSYAKEIIPTWQTGPIKDSG